MKNLILILALVLITAPSFATVVIDMNDVESIDFKNGDSVYVNDIEDEDANIQGVRVTEDKLLIEQNATRDLKAITLISGSKITFGGERSFIMSSARQGGDMGGGGLR